MKLVIVILCAYPGRRRAFALNVSTEDTLEHIFAYCNDGSGMEHQDWQWARVRSLLVGDLVFMDGKWSICASIGWKDALDEDVKLAMEVPVSGDL